MDTRLFTLAETVSLTGAKRRALQLWADGGVIESTRETDRAGTGVHRLFPVREARIAALLVPLADIGTPIGVLRGLAMQLRLFWIAAEAGGVFPEELAGANAAAAQTGTPFVRAARGEGRNYLLLAHTPSGFHYALVTDETGPISIDPERALPPVTERMNAGLTLIIDLNRRLAPLVA